MKLIETHETHWPVQWFFWIWPQLPRQQKQKLTTKRLLYSQENNRTKRQPTNGRIFANCTSDKRLISRIYKELSSQKKKKQIKLKNGINSFLSPKWLSPIPLNSFNTFFTATILNVINFLFWYSISWYINCAPLIIILLPCGSQCAPFLLARYTKESILPDPTILLWVAPSDKPNSKDWCSHVLSKSKY